MDQAFKRLSLNERRIVVSIDFGTTFSGLAWSETKRVRLLFCYEAEVVT
jgi:hypothetical protein